VHVRPPTRSGRIQKTVESGLYCLLGRHRRIYSRSSSESGSETAGRMHRCRFCSKLCGVPAPADTHTVLSCTAGRHPVDQSLCHHDYRTPHPTVRRLVPCRLTHRSCCRRYAYTVEWPQYRGPRHAYMHAYPQQGRGPHVAAWAYDTAAAAATMALAVGLYLLIL